MKIYDGKDAILGRLAAHVAKEALLGEEIAVVNCEDVIITGRKEDIKQDFLQKRSRVGSGQLGPKHSKASERIVKRTIQGMLPNPREGRGRIALKRIKCYIGIPKEFEGKKIHSVAKTQRHKFSRVKEFSK